MIVVVGLPEARDVRAVAVGVAARGGSCEIVGAVPPSAHGDRLLRELAAIRVGHAAILRTPAALLDTADLELALRYLPDCRVIVLVDQGPLAGVAAAAAAWAGATLVVVTTEEALGELPIGGLVVVLSAPARDPDGAFAGVVADLALRLDAGEALATAWPATLGATGAQALSGTAAATEAAVGPVRGAAAGSDPATAPGPARRGSDRRSGRR